MDSTLVSVELPQLLDYQWQFRAAAMLCKLTWSIASTAGALHGQAGQGLGMHAPHSASAGGPQRPWRRPGRRPPARCRPTPPPRRQPQCDSARPFCWACGRLTAGRLCACKAPSAAAVCTPLIRTCKPPQDNSMHACIMETKCMDSSVQMKGYTKGVTVMFAVQRWAVWASW